MRNVFQNIFVYPSTPDQRPLLGAGGAEKAGLATEGHKKIMAAVRAANPGKTILHDPAVEVFADGSECQTLLCRRSFLLITGQYLLRH